MLLLLLLEDGLVSKDWLREEDREERLDLSGRSWMELRRGVGVKEMATASAWRVWLRRSVVMKGLRGVSVWMERGRGIDPIHWRRDRRVCWRKGWCDAVWVAGRWVGCGMELLSLRTRAIGRRREGRERRRMMRRGVRCWPSIEWFEMLRGVVKNGMDDFGVLERDRDTEIVSEVHRIHDVEVSQREAMRWAVVVRRSR
jgi:hypothetical protein